MQWNLNHHQWYWNNKKCVWIFAPFAHKECLKIGKHLAGPVHAESLTLLRTLVLLRCPQLKKIFSNGMIQQLSKLEDLRVEECDQIEEIIMKSENNGFEANQLPRLKTLTLLHLLRLRSIWVDDSLEWWSLQRIEISMCHMLKRLPFNNANATKLRCIEGAASMVGSTTMDGWRCH